jgi:mono/diheme cytochrome c family protein
MYRSAIRSFFVATTALLLLTTAACDKAEEKKTADKKVDDKKVDEVKTPEPPIEPPPVEPPPVEPPPVEPPADAGTVTADAGADAGEPAADGGAEKADGGGEDKPPAEKKPPEKADPEPIAAKADGKAVFESKCKSCHGADGKGDTTIGKKVQIPSLAGTKLSKSKIVSTTESGVPDTKMKGFKDRLTGDEIDAVATYVTKL